MRAVYFGLLFVIASSICTAPEPVKDDNPIIDGTNVTDVPITEVNPPDSTTSSTEKTTTTATSTTTNKTPTTKPSDKTTTTTTTTTEKPTTTKPTDKTTTVVPPTSSTTPTKATTAAPSPPPNNRKFDGPSFVGGIVLALGLVAIGFVAFKFYKARTELNYHTL